MEKFPYLGHTSNQLSQKLWGETQAAIVFKAVQVILMWPQDLTTAIEDAKINKVGFHWIVYFERVDFYGM